METRAQRRFRPSLWIGGVLLVIIGAVALYVWGTLSFAYATGERVGFLQRFSRRGWICKTWEGELAISTTPGVAPEKFSFSTRNERIAAEVNRALGKRVRLKYAQHKFIPSSCFGETEFFVRDVQIIE